MKLSNHLTIRLSRVFMLVLLVWSVVYFFIQMREIYDGIDEGLNNLKQEFVLKANAEEGFVTDMVKYNPLNIIVKEIPAETAYTFQEFYSTEKIYFATELEDEEVRMLTTAFRCDLDGKYYQLKIFTSTVESNDLVKNMLYLLIGLWLSLLLVLVVLGKRIIYNINKPFKNLLSELHKFRLDNSKMIDFEKTKIDEYNELNKAVESLLQENIEAFNNQKNFIENTSHELQTPLAITINKMELMLDNKDITQAQAEEIHSALQLLNRMKKLNSSLLLLGKIKNRQFTDSEVDLCAVFGEVITNFEELIEYKKLTLTVEKTGPCIVHMNADLVYVLASNLIKNAVLYNVKNGELIVSLSPDRIIIMNDGAPLGHDKNIFERYFSNADNLQSSGLGLSIVKSIVDRYNFSISYRYHEKHIITLTIPKTKM